MRYFDKNRIFFAGKEKNRLGFDKKKTALQAVELLKKEYPDAICSLVYTVPHELLIAKIYSKNTVLLQILHKLIWKT